MCGLRFSRKGCGPGNFKFVYKTLFVPGWHLNSGAHSFLAHVKNRERAASKIIITFLARSSEV